MIHIVSTCGCMIRFCIILFPNYSPALCHHSGDCIGILLLILLLCPPGVIVDNLKGDMSELRCRATFWKRRRKVQLEIKRTNANISVSRGKCTIFTRIAFLHFKESCRSVQWGFVQYVKLIFSLFKSGGGADVIVGVQTWRQYDHGSHAVFLSIVTSISLIRQTYLCRCDC